MVLVVLLQVVKAKEEGEKTEVVAFFPCASCFGGGDETDERRGG
jgi:hypothetical protein